MWVRACQRQGAVSWLRLTSGRLTSGSVFGPRQGASCPAVILPLNLGSVLSGARQRRSHLSFLDEPDEPARRPAATAAGGASADRQTLMVRRTHRRRRRRSRPDPARALRPRLPRTRARRTRSRTTSNDSAALLQESKTAERRASSALLQGQGGADRPSTISEPAQRLPRPVGRSSSTAPASSTRPATSSDAQRYLLETLEFRRDGARARSPTRCPTRLGDAEPAPRAPTEVAKQMQVFLASDVIYSQRFVADLVPGAQRPRPHAARRLPKTSSCPTSSGSQPDYGRGRRSPACAPAAAAAAASAGPPRQRPRRRRPRRHGADARAARPASPLTGDLAFEVQVANQGENTETDVKVNVTVGDGSDADRPHGTRSTRSPPGETKTVRSRSTRQPPTGQNVPIKVEVKPVPGEKKTDNNTQTYSRHLHARSRPRPALRTWPVDDLTTTQGSSPSPPRAVGAGRAPLGDRARRSSCAACAPPSAPCSGEGGSATSSPTPASSRRPSYSCATGSRRPPRGLEERHGHGRGADRRLRRLHARSIRYDAYGEMSGPAVEHAWRCWTPHRTGVVVSSILHRDQARVYVKQIHEGESELELSPEEQEAVDAAAWPAPPRRRLMRVAYLGPAGTYSEEALRASAPPGDRGGALPDGLRDRDGGPGRRRSTARWCRSRTRSRAAWRPRSTRSPVDADRRADRRRGGAPDPPLPGRGARDGARGRDAGWCPTPRRPRQCPRFLRERLPRRRARWSPPRRPTRCAGARAPASPGRARLAAGGRAVRLPVLAEDVEDRPDNVTRFVWLAPRRRARGPARGAAPRPRSSSGAPATSRPGWLVAVLREFADRGINLTRIESRPAAVRLGHYMFFADLEGAAAEPPVSEALAALRERVETLRVLGSYPAQPEPSRGLATLAAPWRCARNPVTAEAGDRDPALRARCRAPAGSAPTLRPGARPQRLASSRSTSARSAAPPS